MNRRLIVPIIPTVATPTVQQIQPAPPACRAEPARGCLSAQGVPVAFTPAP